MADFLPTWVLVNVDNLLGLPIVGQFPPNIQRDRGKPIWQKKPGILGSQPWLKYIGEDLGYMSFEFLFMANNILDHLPVTSWNRLVELSKYDTTLGRPPRVVFTHGQVVVEGFITELPEAPIEYWGGTSAIKSRIIRQIGPIRITVTEIPSEGGELSAGTNFITKTEETRFEDLALHQYGDARYSHSLELYNQGKLNEDTLELPRKSSGFITKETVLSPLFGDDIEGL